jgi:hypothetical protein
MQTVYSSSPLNIAGTSLAVDVRSVYKCVFAPLFHNYWNIVNLNNVQDHTVDLHFTMGFVLFSQYEYIHRVSQEECAKIRESVPYVNLLKTKRRLVFKDLVRTAL